MSEEEGEEEDESEEEKKSEIGRVTRNLKGRGRPR